MSGRRSYPRFSINPPSEGTMRVLRDVVIERTVQDGFVVIGRSPGAVGEIMTFAVADPGAALDTRVRVVESSPVIIDGAVRHRVRLERVRTNQAPAESAAARQEIGSMFRETT